MVRPTLPTSHLVMASALLLVSAVQPGQTQQQALDQGLHSLFVASGKLFFGTAIDTNNFDDTAYQTIATNKNEFGLYVPENSQKWGPIEPTQGQFRFANPDSVEAQAQNNDQIFRCHALAWHSQLPSFIANGTWTRPLLIAALQSHITIVMTHYKSRCYSWDVVNEALNDNGTLRDSVFLRVLGTDYLPLSFAAAAAADPSAKLYYNDFNLETIPAKADGAVRLVKLIQAAGVRIDGIGFQAHLTVGGTPSQAKLAATLNRFVALGLEVTLSELDIAHNKLPASARAVEQQAKDYVTAVGACLSVPKCVGITVWQFTDKYSWIPSTFPGKGDACLFTANFTKKPAYTAVARCIDSGGCASGDDVAI
ncbi:glycoside hydrolase family 10 protein [Bombardia bombarda]|uniref:Beta-xylanase n=1 Tax=Bombardia bombarda TaxID=252184 RepID=A0AA39XNB9_9PEZI|nr:glycoside hydrolase family 10 protein [Bombardia bombarda]